MSFNPRARDGRENWRYRDLRRWYVSIHAPVMDANWFVHVMAWIVRFQSTRP